MGYLAKRIGVRGPEHKPRVHEDALVRMRDGVGLRTVRVGPAEGGRRPTVLIRTPYGIGWNLPLPIIPLTARFLARRGYHVVVQDTRGRYGSEGSFYPFIAEEADGRDAIEWVAKQDWFDGQVAMWGASYFGYTQWAIAAEPPPYLKALVPIVTSTDFHALFYPGGAFSLISALRWAASNGDKKGTRSPERRLPAAARARPLREAVDAVGREAPFFSDWIDHPEADAYWHDINHPKALGSNVPSLLIAGTYDIFCGPQLADFAALGDSTCLDLGPYAHGTYAISARKLGWKQAGMMRIFPATLEFLDHHLMGRPLERGRVRRYVQGEDRWLEDSGWPPPDAVGERSYLRAGGRLDSEAPGGDEEPDRYPYDPNDRVPSRGGTFLGPKCGPEDQRPLESRKDVLRYETAPLRRPLSLAGPVKLHLRASSDAPATDFTAKLVQVPADDRRPALNLCEGVRRLPRVDGEAVAVEIDLWHASVTIPSGDRLRLEVSSSNFPRYDAHPNVLGNPGLAREPRTAAQTIHHAADAPSYLELPVL